MKPTGWSVTQIAELQEAVDEARNDAARAESRIETVLNLHHLSQDGYGDCCHCGRTYPCPTARALGIGAGAA